MRLGKALAAIAMAAGLLVTTTGTAHAAYWINRVRTGESDKDSGGRWATSMLINSESGSYYVYFEPYGEILWVKDDKPDGHAARARVVVSDSEGHRQDSDTFYVGTADGMTSFNLGTPDGSGDIEEGMRVTVYVCINETSTCSGSAFGRA